MSLTLPLTRIFAHMTEEGVEVCVNGSLEEMIASLESGALVNRVVDEFGRTALHLAAKDRKFGEAKPREMIAVEPLSTPET